MQSHKTFENPCVTIKKELPAAPFFVIAVRSAQNASVSGQL